ncbi:MAG: PIN/TRAM domain-containing protein [Armatimonadaceae bacterium]
MTKIKNKWRSILTIRFIFTILLAGLLGVIGWYTVDLFLNWVMRDDGMRSLFGRALVVVYNAVFVTVGGIFGFALGGFIFRQIELTAERLRVMSAREKIALIGGLVTGLILTAIVSIPLILVIAQKLIAVGVSLLLGIALTYLCTAAALSMKEEIHLYMPPPAAEDDKIPQDVFKILDTNVIIDGRVADIAAAGFIEGTIYVPGFVLEELQHIADSADSLKRQRGRRGLDVLEQMKKEIKLTLRTYDRLAPPGEEVDARLVRLAKALNGSLVTNDFNLNKVAGLQGVNVLNINELANAVKPVVLPGEDLQVTLVKEGKEPTQGIGYLDDGTMIVVAGGRAHLGETVGVRVTSLMQTVQGKMIFAQLADSGYGDDSDDDYYGDGGGDERGGDRDGYSNGSGNRGRGYSRGGSRRAVRREPK